MYIDIDNLPKKIAYRKNGFLYIYELEESPICRLYGSELYGDYGILELTGDKEYADKFKRYSYVKVYSTEPEVKLGVVDTSNLKNIENFRQGALEHIFEGEINRRGEAVGYHYEDYPTAKGSIIEGTKTKINNNGVYRASVEIDGIKKINPSTFFPENLSSQEVINAINEAYMKRVNFKGNVYRAKTSSGMEIEMFLDKDNKIISAFPKYLRR